MVLSVLSNAGPVVIGFIFAHFRLTGFRQTTLKCKHTSTRVSSPDNKLSSFSTSTLELRLCSGGMKAPECHPTHCDTYALEHWHKVSQKCALD